MDFHIGVLTRVEYDTRVSSREVDPNTPSTSSQQHNEGLFFPFDCGSLKSVDCLLPLLPRNGAVDSLKLESTITQIIFQEICAAN